MKRLLLPALAALALSARALPGPAGATYNWGAQLTVAEPPDQAELLWTYGWPTAPKENPAAGEAPTGVRAVLHGANRLLLLIF